MTKEGLKHVPWNKGKLTGAKPPLRPKHVWAIRTKLQVEGRLRDLAMFNLARVLIPSAVKSMDHEQHWLCPRSGRSLWRLDALNTTQGLSNLRVTFVELLFKVA